jgi:hypothetical protein
MRPRGASGPSDAKEYGRSYSWDQGICEGLLWDQRICEVLLPRPKDVKNLSPETKGYAKSYSRDQRIWKTFLLRPKFAKSYSRDQRICEVFLLRPKDMRSLSPETKWYAKSFSWNQRICEVLLLRPKDMRSLALRLKDTWNDRIKKLCSVMWYISVMHVYGLCFRSRCLIVLRQTEGFCSLWGLFRQGVSR